MKTIITIGTLNGTKSPTTNTQSGNNSYNTNTQANHKELKLLDGKSNSISYK